MKPSFRKANAPALGISKRPLIRASPILAVMISVAALGGCAQKLIPPDISYDDMTPAVQMGELPCRWRSWRCRSCCLCQDN